MCFCPVSAGDSHFQAGVVFYLWASIHPNMMILYPLQRTL